MLETTALLAGFNSNGGRARLARSANNLAASSEASGGTDHACSCVIPSASRLVARTRTRGQSRVIVVATSAHALTTCSQLSRTSNAARSRNWMTIESSGERPVDSRNPSTSAIVCATADGAVTGARSTHTALSHTSGTATRARRSASCVFPAPPGPTSVTTRAV